MRKVQVEGFQTVEFSQPSFSGGVVSVAMFRPLSLLSCWSVFDVRWASRVIAVVAGV